MVSEGSGENEKGYLFDPLLSIYVYAMGSKRFDSLANNLLVHIDPYIKYTSSYLSDNFYWAVVGLFELRGSQPNRFLSRNRSARTIKYLTAVSIHYYEGLWLRTLRAPS